MTGNKSLHLIRDVGLALRLNWAEGVEDAGVGVEDNFVRSRYPLRMRTKGDLDIFHTQQPHKYPTIRMVSLMH